MMRKKIVPSPEDNKDDKDLNYTIKYPDYIGIDDAEAKIKYAESASTCWKGELTRLKAIDNVERGDGDSTSSSSIPSKGRKSTVHATTLIKMVTSNGVSPSIVDNDDNDEDEGETNKQTVLCSVFRAMRGEIDNTVGRYVLQGEWKSSLLSYVLTLTLYGIGAMIACLSLWNFIPRVYVYSVLLCVPRLIQEQLEWNINIAYFVIRQQANIAYWIYSLVFASSLYIEYYGQDHYPGVALLITILLWSCCVVPFFDCLPVKLRVLVNKVLVPMCILLLILWILSLSFNWANSKGVSISFLGHINVTSAGIASSACNNVIILLTLNVWTVFRYPDSLVTVRSRVEAVQMREDRAISIRSYDALLHEISESHRVGGQMGLRVFFNALHCEVRQAAGYGEGVGEVK
jgi:hypothetical protein